MFLYNNVDTVVLCTDMQKRKKKKARHGAAMLFIPSHDGVEHVGLNRYVGETTDSICEALSRHAFEDQNQRPPRVA